METYQQLKESRDQLRAECERLKGKADECWGAANYRLKYLGCLFRALGMADDEQMENRISDAAEAICHLRARVADLERASDAWGKAESEAKLEASRLHFRNIELEADKARLDWLENVAFKLHYGNCDKYEHHDYVAHIHSGGTYYSGKVLPLRQAIDAAHGKGAT